METYKTQAQKGFKGTDTAEMSTGRGNAADVNFAAPAPTGIEDSQNTEIKDMRRICEPSKMEEIENYIRNISEFGLITKEQGDLIRQNLIKTMDTAAADVQIPDMVDFENLNECDFKFFEDRKNLKKYLKDSGIKLDRGEFEKIYTLVNELENQAVQRFQQICREGEILKQQNELAKQKLNTASSRAIHSGLDVVKKFTPQEIGKMSTAEFLKNEALINRQLKEKNF